MKNIRLSILVLFAVAFSNQIQAQGPKLKLGLFGGPGISQFWGYETIAGAKQPMISFLAGVSVEAGISDFLSIRALPGFEQKGTNMEVMLTDANGIPRGNQVISERVNFASVPLLLRASVGKERNFFFEAGPYAAYYLGDTDSGPGLMLDGFYQDFDFGLTTGVGYMFDLSTNLAISIEARNSLGLKNISAVQLIGNGKMRTQSTNLLVGLNYSL